MNKTLTVLRLLPHDALQVDAGAWLTGSQALGLRGERGVGCVHGHRARPDHQLLAGGRDVPAGPRDEGVERRRSRRGDRRLHLEEGRNAEVKTTHETTT